MTSATIEVAEVLPSVSDAIGFLAMAAVLCSVYGPAEHPIMPLETQDVLRRLNQESKQIQQCRGVLGLWIERVEIWALIWMGSQSHTPHLR